MVFNVNDDLRLLTPLVAGSHGPRATGATRPGWFNVFYRFSHVLNVFIGFLVFLMLIWILI